ncbi:hypothetical protein AXF42_Ash000916 [Apostasia shenzhenica]|uniref:Uncharacterized protein n=1 Tax=Apostasia shenzhenica TaxID=1088818 RepID=A0A2I0ATF2_9ASPA|nr:hypothetical protein AXF42_Ash000916 [Apostasia shenzhenica]
MRWKAGRGELGDFKRRVTHKHFFRNFTNEPTLNKNMSNIPFLNLKTRIDL